MVWMQPSKSISTQIWGFSKNLNVNPWNKEYFIFHFWSSTGTTVKHFWVSQLCDFPGFLPPMSGDPWIAALLLVDSRWMLLKDWYCPHHTAGLKKVWYHGSLFPSVLFHHSHSSCGGEYLVLDLISDLFTAVHTPKVNAHSSYGLLAAVKHSLSHRPWYHNHLESVSLLEFYILSLINRD